MSSYPVGLDRSIYCSAGTDPELLLMNSEGMGVPAGYITTVDKTTMGGWGKDGAAVEFWPNKESCLEYLQRNLRNCVVTFAQKLPREVIPTLAPAVEFSPRSLKKYPETLEFGCQASNYLTGDGDIALVQQKVDPKEFPFRTAGFHVHLGMLGSSRKALKKDPSDLLHMLDVFVGLPGTILEQRWSDLAILRRLRVGYGLPGEHRFPKHGIEYRTLGPWPMCNPIWTWWAFSTVRNVAFVWQATEKTDNDKNKLRTPKMPPRQEVYEAIVSSNPKQAYDLWKAAVESLREVYEEYLESLHQQQIDYYQGLYDRTRRSNGKECADRLIEPYLTKEGKIKHPTPAFRKGNDTLHFDNVVAFDHVLTLKRPLEYIRGEKITWSSVARCWKKYKDHTANAWAASIERKSKESRPITKKVERAGEDYILQKTAEKAGEVEG